jgi:hypothetical protein
MEVNNTFKKDKVDRTNNHNNTSIYLFSIVMPKFLSGTR